MTKKSRYEQFQNFYQKLPLIQKIVVENFMRSLDDIIDEEYTKVEDIDRACYRKCKESCKEAMDTIVESEAIEMELDSQKIKFKPQVVCEGCSFEKWRKSCRKYEKRVSRYSVIEKIAEKTGKPDVADIENAFQKSKKRGSRKFKYAKESIEILGNRYFLQGLDIEPQEEKLNDLKFVFECQNSKMQNALIRLAENLFLLSKNYDYDAASDEFRDMCKHTRCQHCEHYSKCYE